MSDDSGPDAAEIRSLRTELSDRDNLGEANADQLLRLLAQVAGLDSEQRAALLGEEE
jgi:hypothetical protein